MKQDRVDPIVPRIIVVEPDRVKQHWEGEVFIHGENFDAQSFSQFNGLVPATVARAALFLKVAVKANITGTTGDKKVIVHNSDGAISNAVIFTVEAKPELA